MAQGLGLELDVGWEGGHQPSVPKHSPTETLVKVFMDKFGGGERFKTDLFKPHLKSLRIKYFQGIY